MAKKRLSAKPRVEAQRSGFTSTAYNPGEVELFAFDKAQVYYLDILPFRAGPGNPYTEEGEDAWERTFFQHRGISENEMDGYICPRKSTEHLKRKLPCPVCEWLSEQRKLPDVDKEDLNEMAAKARQLFVVRAPDWDENDFRVMEISHFFFGKLLNQTISQLDDDEEDFQYFADLTEGYTLKIGVVEESFSGKKFYKPTSIGFKKRKHQYEAGIVDEVPNPDKMITMLTYDQLKEVMEQGAGDEDGDEDGDEEEVPAPTKPSGVRASTTKAATKPSTKAATKPAAKSKVAEVVDDDDVPFDVDVEPADDPSAGVADEDWDSWDD